MRGDLARTAVIDGLSNVEGNCLPVGAPRDLRHDFSVVQGRLLVVLSITYSSNCWVDKMHSMRSSATVGYQRHFAVYIMYYAKDTILPYILIYSGVAAAPAVMGAKTVACSISRCVLKYKNS